MKQKRSTMVIFAIIVLVIVVVVAIAVSSGNNEEVAEGQTNEIEGNANEKAVAEKTYNGLDITNVVLTNSETVTSILADVTNNTSSATAKQEVDINILDEEGNVITTFGGVIEALEVGETTTLSAGKLASYSNAYDVEIVEAE